jgi:hypothetical protein
VVKLGVEANHEAQTVACLLDGLDDKRVLGVLQVGRVHLHNLVSNLQPSSL